MYPEEPINYGGRRGNPNALRPPPPYSRPPPYARPPPPYSRPTSEDLLFDDVFREKAVALRSVMTEFLLVQPFYKFDAEFQHFLTRVKRMTAEGQRAVAAAAAVRDANALAASNNMTVDAARSTVAAASRSERPPPPPYVFGLRCSSDYGEHQPSVDQPGTSASAGPSTNRISLAAPHLYGDAANNGNGSNASRFNPTSSGSLSTKIHEKILSKWSVEVMTLDLACSVSVLKLSGTLLAEDKVTILEETHDAGMIESRKGTNIIKTTHGLYHLNGPIASGFSNDFYHACLENHGFPKNWRNFLIQLSNDEETNEDPTNANTSVTRNGTNFKSGAQKSIEKGKLIKQHLAKQKVVMQQLSQASASKTIEQFNTSCKTPSQFLKYQFHRKLVKACKIVTSQFK